MESVVLDMAGHRRSPATMPGYHRGRVWRGACARNGCTADCACWAKGSAGGSLSDSPSARVMGGPLLGLAAPA
jgi:hypothetical protein